MRSFISNFDRWVRHLSCWKAAVVAAAAALVLCGLYEGYWKSRGFEASVEDTMTFWALHRDQVYASGGKKALAIIGYSRAHLGLVPEIFREGFPSMKVLQLSIDGTPAYSILKDLAEDPRFDGWILCDTLGFRGPDLKGKPYVDYYHVSFRAFWGRWAAMNEKIDTLLRAWLESHLIFLSPELRPERALYFKVKPYHAHMEYDRYRPAHFYSKMTPKDLQALRQKRIEFSAPGPKELMDKKKEASTEKFSRTEIARFNELMEKKGGKLILLRMPTSDEHLRSDEMVFPKKIWDHLHEWTGALTVHFMDHPGLRSFQCPDTSHLDAADAVKFSRNLVEILKSLTQGSAPLGNSLITGYNESGKS